MRIINDQILPKELLKVLENDDLEGSGGVMVTSLDYFADDAKVELSILLDGSDEDNQLWEVQIEGIRNERIVRDWAENILTYDQHFLIKEQKDSTIELYIKNAASDSNKLLSDLYRHFSTQFENYISFDKYLNTSNNLDFLFKMENGLFAKGPKFIMIEMNNILEKNGCSTYYYGETSPKRLSNNQWIEEVSDLVVLSVGQSYFVAENISFERV
jgi:hypothetical protein